MQARLLQQLLASTTQSPQLADISGDVHDTDRFAAAGFYRETIAKRADPSAEHIPCPTCRGNVKRFLQAEPYTRSLEAPALAPAPAAAVEDDEAADISIDGSDDGAADIVTTQVIPTSWITRGVD